MILWAAIALPLLGPLLAMQVTAEMNWGAEDFAAAALLLVGGGAAFEVAARLTGDTRRRVVIGAIILAVVALTWAHGAVWVF